MSSPQILQAIAAASIPPAAPMDSVVADTVPRTSECLRFVTGEWLINECWREATAAGRSRPTHRRRLYFQRSAAAPCEAMGEIAACEAGAPVMGAMRPLLFRSGERCAIVLGPVVFQRWQRQQGPYWCRVMTQPFGAAAFFLRSYLKERDTDALAHSLSLPDVAYDFGHIDLERNVLVTCRQQADPRFPQFLVYSAAEYGLAWQFDAERTRRVNGIRRQADAYPSAVCRATLRQANDPARPCPNCRT